MFARVAKRLPKHAIDVNPGVLQTVIGESDAAGDEVAVELAARIGVNNADLSLGSSVGLAGALWANLKLSNRGVQLFGSGFIIDEDRALAFRNVEGADRIRDYRDGRDLTDRPRGFFVIALLACPNQKRVCNIRPCFSIY